MPVAITAERSPYYGHFYGFMDMFLLGQEYKQDKDFREKTGGYIAGTQKELLAWQTKDGSWAAKGGLFPPKMRVTRPHLPRLRCLCQRGG
jgi:hypothetical protein